MHGKARHKRRAPHESPAVRWVRKSNQVMSYIKCLIRWISQRRPVALLCLAAALVLAGLLAFPDSASAKSIVGRSGWLLVIGLAEAGRRLARDPASPRRLSRVIGCLVLYISLVSGEALHGAPPAPWLGELATGALGLPHGSLWATLALAAFGIGLGLPLWGGRKWPDLLECWGERIETTGLSALHLARRPPTTARGAALSTAAAPAFAREEALAQEEPERKTGSAPPARPAPRAAEPALTSSAGSAREPEVIDLPWMVANLEKRYAGASADARRAAADRRRPQPPVLEASRAGTSPWKAKAGRAVDTPVDELEVIDLDWIKANLAKHYRRKARGGAPQASENKAGKESSAMMDVEEVRRRVLDIHGGQLPGEARRRPPRQPARTPAVATPRAAPSGAAVPDTFTPMPSPASVPTPDKSPARGVLKSTLYGLGVTRPRESPPAPLAPPASPTPALPRSESPVSPPISAPGAVLETNAATQPTGVQSDLAPPPAQPEAAETVHSTPPAPITAPITASVVAPPLAASPVASPVESLIPTEELPALLLETPAPTDVTGHVAPRPVAPAMLEPTRAVLPAAVGTQLPPALLAASPASDATEAETYPGFTRPEVAVPPPALAAPAVDPLSDAQPLFRPQAEHQHPRYSHETYAPSLDLLQPASSTQEPISQEELDRQGRLIQERLADFRVNVTVEDACAGPVITRYEVSPAVGVRGAQVVNLMKDLARALGLTSIRVVETIPGKTCMGLELPNPRRQMICLSEVLSAEVFQSHGSKLAMALGKDITGNPVVADLAKAPHMLVAGTTGSGKSVGVNAMIVSLLYRATPDEVRFIMIDPKMLELSVYDGIPHLLAPVVTDMKLAANALNWCVGEMERRYRLMSALGVRNLAGYNQKVAHAREVGRPLYDPFSITPDSPAPLTHLPFIVVVVDEFADLMMVAGKKIEELIARLAQKARAAGIHLILATQRPSVDVITGLIKANIPTRIAFQVSSKIDSRTILDQMGAEALLGQGDMLYLPPGTGYPQRVHGAFVADEEVHALAEHLKLYGEPDYVEAVLGTSAEGEGEAEDADASTEEADPLYDEAVAIVIRTRRASISLVQRQLRIGYNRAARLVEQMEVSGVVSPMESNGNRTVLVPAS